MSLSVSLTQLNETYGSGKILRIEDRTPFYLLEYNEKRIFSRKIRSYTLEEIVVKIVCDPSDIDFFSNFIHTYYLVKITPSTFLRMLIDLYHHPSVKFTGSIEAIQKKLYKSFGEIEEDTQEDLIRDNIISIIKRWIGSFYDFYDFPVLVTIAEQFLDDIASLSKSNDKLKKHLSLRDFFLSFKTISKNFSDKLQKSSSSLSISLNTPLLAGKIPTDILAQQITLIEYSIIRNVRGRELISPNDQKSTNISKYLNHFKKMRGFFIEEFVKEESARGCAHLIKRSVKLAHYCITYNNFNTPMEILSALFSPVMLSQEKSQSWEHVSVKVFDMLVAVCDLLSPDNNYEKYKEALSVNPSVPFLGIHIGDIRFINDYNRTENAEGISIEKITLMSTELKRITSVQGLDFSFEDDFDLQTKILSNLIVMGDKEMEKLNVSSSSIKDESNRLNLLAQRYVNFVSDAVLLGREEVDSTNHLLRNRDWVVLSTNAVTRNYNKGDLIISENSLGSNSSVQLLMEGRVNLFKNNTYIKSVSSHAILGETVVLDSLASNPEVVAETKVTVAVVEKNFIISLLESDPPLCLRFYSTVALQLIDQFRVSSAKSSTRPTPLRKAANFPSNSRLPIVVKPIIFNHGSGSLLLDPKSIRDQEVRLLFNWKENDVLLKEVKATMLGRTMNSQGMLFITQHFIGFFSKVFRHEYKVVISFYEIQKASKKKNKIFIETKKKKFALKFKGDEEETFSLIEGIIEKTEENQIMSSDSSAPSSSSSSSSSLASSVEKHTSSLESWKEPIKSHPISLTQSDWTLLLRGSKRITFKKNDIVMFEGDNLQRIFQVSRGSCRIEKKSGDGESFILGTIGTGDIFGEISFVLRKNATASVISDSDDLQVILIEGHYLKRLFEMRPEIAGKFMHYICTVAQRRLGNREWFEDQEERRVVDIISDPLHMNLVKIPVIAEDSLTPIHSLEGPLLNEDEERKSWKSNSRSYCSATSISTYPMRNHINDLGENILKRDGTPICDQFKAVFFQRRGILAVADGCNWGDPPRDAAVAARNAFVKYLQNHQREITDLQVAGNIILRAFAMSNAAIFHGKSLDDQIGTTTLLGGIVLQFYSENEKPSWGFIYGSVGDCKALHWSATTGEFADITEGNRSQSNNASDCGGRLGPHLAGDLPDLRNLELGFYPCDQGDMILLVSDGVHDNLDPCSLGFSPRDVGIDFDEWQDVDPVVAEESKIQFRLSLLKKIITNQIHLKSSKEEKRRSINPKSVVQTIIQYCIDTCSAATAWMEANPNKRLPKDYRLYPGKMDHTTALCYVVGEISDDNIISGDEK